MPNIGALLKQEIVRLARKESRAEGQANKKASAQHRRHIAALRRQVATLERQVALLRRSTLDRQQTAATASPQKLRFVAKGLKSHRSRLGLSAADYGKLVGVSAQSVYNWEQGNASPRPEQLKRIAALRAISKRDAHAQLARSGASSAHKR